jgi:tripartite-type tricarboxylate transporter receptor subunit TctC
MAQSSMVPPAVGVKNTGDANAQWIARIAVLVLSSAGFALAVGDARAQGYPNKPVTVVVPYGPGSGNDVIARIIAQKVSETWSQPMVVDNRPGANGAIAAELVAKAVPDGYTLLIGSSSTIVNQYVSRDVRFDIAKDFAPVGFCGSLHNVLAVHEALPVQSLRELVALAKSRPGQLNWAASSAATHLVGDVFKSAAGIDFAIIDYKLTSTGVTDVASGRVEMLWTTTASALPLVKSGKLRVLGVTGDRRLSVLPDVPTMAETGFPALDVSVDFFILAPAATARPVVAALNGEIVKAIGAKDVRERLAGAGVEPKSSTSEELAEFITSDVARWVKLIKETGFRAPAE